MALLRRTYRALDATAGSVARSATTLGQLGLAALGAHLAADRLDDHLLRQLTDLQGVLAEHSLPGLLGLSESVGLAPSHLSGWVNAPLAPTAARLALAIELAAIAVLSGAIVLTPRDGRPSMADWWAARSVHAVLLPITLGGCLLAGAWSLAMALEDLLPASELAPWVSRFLAGVALTRFGIPALLRSTAAVAPRTRWSAGLKRGLVLAPIAALVWLEAIPFGGLASLLRGLP